MNIKIAYIGGGSKSWARVFMNDLALTEGLAGEISLYDIDSDASVRNQAIGMAINQDKRTRSHFDYVVTENIQKTLSGADFVIISILPGTFATMAVDVHLPERYGIWQPVGDTTGPGGVLRSMRTVPMFEFFAREIEKYCPHAWVINLTNPLAICVKTLKDVFPKMNVFGCCHEVFNAQVFLTKVVEAMLGIQIDRQELVTDVSGINHFTWISKASTRQVDVLALLPKFMETNFEKGINAEGAGDAYLTDPMKSANRVKMDLFRRYGILGAAGDRHLAEFMDPTLYLSSPKTVRSWSFALTPVSYRIRLQQKKINESIQIATGKKKPILKKSKEEVVELMRSLMGEKRMISNVNLPNEGQMPQMKMGAVVETNALFSLNSVMPIVATKLVDPVRELVSGHLDLTELLYEAIKKRQLEDIYQVFRREPQCRRHPDSDMRQLFTEMVRGTRDQLEHEYDLSCF